MVSDFKFGRKNSSPGFNYEGVVWGENRDVYRYTLVNGEIILTHHQIEAFRFNNGETLQSIADEGYYVYVYQIISLSDGRVYSLSNILFDSNRSLNNHVVWLTKIEC